MKVPYVDIGAQYLEHRDEILAALDKFFASGDYILNSDVNKFEKNFAELCGVPHAIGAADGTVALSMCMRVLGIGSGDEVITCPNSFFSSASSVVHVGATPVFADSLPDLTIDPEKIIAAITPKTKAIIPVHLTGKMCRMDEIMAIAKKYNLYVIEDAAQSVGASYKGKKAGSIGDFGCFSLHPLKNLNAAGDAGVITTKNKEHDTALRRMRNHGMIDRDTIPEFGYNSRIDSIQACYINVKLPYLGSVVERRIANADLYRSRLKNVVEVPVTAEDSTDVYHLFVIQCDKRDELKKFLETQNISSSIHYPVPIHLFECSRKLGHKPGDYPVTERQATRILSLPVHQNLSKEQINYVCDKIIEFYSASTK